MTSMYLGNASGQELLVVLTDRVVSPEGGQGSSLVDGFERSTELGFASAIGTATAELAVRDEATIVEILA